MIPIRERIIVYLKTHPKILSVAWCVSKMMMRMLSYITPRKDKTMLFCSFGGRKFDDSPKAIYEEVCSRKEFIDWDLIWVFINPDEFDIPRGHKIKIDTISFFYALLTSRVWISNSGMDRGIGLKSPKNLRVETWHGTPLKKICGEENQNSFGTSPEKYKGKLDGDTIRCSQSNYDREIFARIFHAEISSILLSDLPRNDGLFKYRSEDIISIKNHLEIPLDKKVILYTPTYREYLINDDHQTYIAPPINLDKWKQRLSDDYVLLIRAHYAVSAALNIHDNDFIKDVSSYHTLNDLYIISDMMISDYSSTYFDYAILNRPMLCFAYDRDEYETKRGLYLNLDTTLPCEIDYTEDSLLDRIANIDFKEASERTKKFHKRFAPFAGNASRVVVDTVLAKL